jgi:thioredoxin 1
MKKLESIDEIAAFVAEGKSLIKIGTKWCTPCKMIEKGFERMEADHPEIKIGLVDADDNPEIAMSYHITSVPVVISYKDGNVINQHIGAKPTDVYLKDMV